MNHWICNCGKKVSENLKACPYCKALREVEIKIVSGDTKYLKAIIGLLVAILLVAGVYIFKQPESSQGKQIAPTYNPGDTKADNKSLPKPVPATAIEAINALKKLQARVEVGISYRDYSPALGEVKYAVDMFLTSQSAKDFPALVIEINKAFANFTMAGLIWDEKFKGDGIQDLLKSNHPIVAEILKLNPDLDKPAANGGIFYDDIVAIGKLIPLHFSIAKNYTNKAAALIVR